MEFFYMVVTAFGAMFLMAGILQAVEHFTNKRFPPIVFLVGALAIAGIILKFVE